MARRDNNPILSKLYISGSKKCAYCGSYVCRSRTSSVRWPNTATIDHVYPRYDIRRYAMGGDKKVVLCCYECNQKRTRRDFNAMNDQYYTETNIYDIRLIDLLKWG